MLRTNQWTGVVIFIAVALALAILLSGHTRNDLRSRMNKQSVSVEPTVAADGVPEVVVTGRRTQPRAETQAAASP